MPLDLFGRNIHYLRVSVTDHCNLRCIYCMPEEMIFRPSAELLTSAEILRLVALFTRLGVDKVRLTGGEPTVHPEIVEITRGIHAIPGINQITMTTNGVRLVKLAEPLKQAGLDRVNISLDTTDRHEFKKISMRDYFDHAMNGIVAAENAGLTPIKINTVIVRGVNDEAVLDIAALTLYHNWQVRFIELMPLGGATDVQQKGIVTMQEMVDKIENEFGKLRVGNGGNLDGEARIMKINGAKGDLGFISSVSNPFCASCTRARITSDGKLRLCLLREDEVDLLTPMRAGASDEDLRRLIIEGIWHKPWGHGLADGVVATNRAMSEIGG
jgi:cyclic pyranopterin phosphate synthase